MLFTPRHKRHTQCRVGFLSTFAFSFCFLPKKSSGLCNTYFVVSSVVPPRTMHLSRLPWSSLVYWSDPPTASRLRECCKTIATSCSRKDLVRCFRRSRELMDAPTRPQSYTDALCHAITAKDMKLFNAMIEEGYHVHSHVDRSGQTQCRGGWL